MGKKKRKGAAAKGPRAKQKEHNKQKRKEEGFGGRKKVIKLNRYRRRGGDDAPASVPPTRDVEMAHDDEADDGPASAAPTFGLAAHTQAALSARDASVSSAPVRQSGRVQQRDVQRQRD